MASIKATKRIGSTGDSLIIPITREAKEYGLEKGDMISVIIPDPSEVENHDYEFACMLSNPNASYENTRTLTPADTLLDGQSIPDRSDDIDDEDCVKFSTLMKTRSSFTEIMADAIRDTIDGDFARYSDTMRSFILEFSPTSFVDHDLQVTLDQACAVKIVRQLVERSCIYYSALRSVSSLAEHLDLACEDIFALYRRLNNDENKDDILKELNSSWDHKVSGKTYPDMWYVAITVVFPIIDDYPECFGSVDFGLYEAPCPQYVQDLLTSAEPENFRHHNAVDRIVLGPYPNQESAQDMLSHFRMTARSNNMLVDESFTSWCKNESRRIMDV